MKRLAVAATVVVLIHLAASLLHGRAHEALGVGLSTWQLAFVRIVIIVAPLVAAALYWTRLRESGALLLSLSMLGALLFGIYNHFIAISTDHVSHLPPGEAQGFFVVTAILLIPVDAACTAFGFWSWRRIGRGTG